MTNEEWITQSLDELQSRIEEQEDEFVDMFINDYLGDFYVDDTSLKTTSGNFDKINAINRKFDDAYEAFILPFLVWYGQLLVRTAKVSVSSFREAKIEDIAWVNKQIGIDGKKIIKGSYLWNLGRMGEMRQRFQDMVVKAVSSGQKYNKFLRDAKMAFKSTTKQRSWLSSYYMRYAYDAVAQTLNATSYYLAKKYGYTRFIYEGGIIKDTRPFCRERAGNEYTIEQGQEWNQMIWKGKIPNVDFFIQCGGYNCIHSLNWTK